MVERDGKSLYRTMTFNYIRNAFRLFKSVFFVGLNSGIGHEPNGGVTTVDILNSHLPAGKRLTVAARPVSSLGTKGKAIATTYSA